MSPSSIIGSYDDGHRLDLRVAESLRRHGLPGMFFIPNRLCQLTHAQIMDLARDFEIGGHTTAHPEDLKAFDYESQLQMIRDNKAWLEDIIGRPITWFCYPSGRYNDDTLRAVRECGYEHARTTFIGETQSEFEIRVDMHVYPFGQARMGPDYDWFEWGLSRLRTKIDQGLPYHFFAHSFELEKYQLWDRFEELLCRMKTLVTPPQ